MSTSSQAHYLDIEQVGDVTVVKVLPAQILEEQVAQSIADQLAALVEKEGCRQLVLNFANVRIMTSTMLAKLLALRKKVHALGGRLALCETNPELDEVFEALHLPHLFAFFPEEQEAVQSLQ